MIQLLMLDRCDTPSRKRICEVLNAHIGRVEQIGNGRNHAKDEYDTDSDEYDGNDAVDEPARLMSFAALDHIARFEDASVPVQLTMGTCEPFDGSRIDEFVRDQMWSCRDSRDEILSECKYSILATDMLGGALPSRERANLLMDYLEALLELYPSCIAVYSLNSGKLTSADTIRAKKASGPDRFIEYMVNARFFNIQDTDDSIVDTLGLSLLFIEDLQYCFSEMDPDWVVGHTYAMASYLLDSGDIIENGDTIDGIADGALSQDVQWECHYEEAIVPPERTVLNISVE